MAKFQVKNLMIDVVSAKADRLEKLCLFPSVACGRFFTDNCEFLTGTVDGCFKDATNCDNRSFIFTGGGGCGLNYSTCMDGSRTFVIDLERLVVNPADIDLVRKQLGQVMEMVEGGAREVKAGPQTLQQAELLEGALTEALEEVQRMKRGLR